MFEAIARFDIRFRWLIVAVWIVGVVAGVKLLPSLSSVSQSNNTQFLSSTSPSVIAGRLAEPFQGKNPAATAIIVASRASGPLTAADTAAIGRVEQAARQVPGVSLVKDEGTAKDGTAAEALVTVSVAAANGNASAKNVVAAIRADFGRAGAPAGLSFHLTGQLAVSVDASNTHVASIERYTVLFVIVLLFAVYRALAGGNSQAQQLGFAIAFGVVLDTFFVRTLLVPSIAMLLGQWNWWPSRVARPAVTAPSAPAGSARSAGEHAAQTSPPPGGRVS